MDLIYKKDKNGKDILCNEDERHQIMMEWEKPYMEKSIEMLNPFGKVLEIGFGMGYSATKMCSFENVKEYNVIECMPIVWEKFKEFKTQQQTARPELKINLIKGRWEDVLQTTATFDCIYFDDYALNADMDPGNRKITHDRLSIFLCKVLQKHTTIGSRISFYSTVNCLEMYKHINCTHLECSEYNIEIPADCKYARGGKMYIPIMTKTSSAEPNLHEKLVTSNSNNVNGVNQEYQENLKKGIEKQMKYKKLFDDIQTRTPSCGLIVIDNFHKNPYEVRKHILTLPFSVRGNHPGQRTVSYATQKMKDIIQEYVMPFGGRIKDFPIPDENKDDDICNGAFQYTTSRTRSWVRNDRINNWGGILHMTPNAPLQSGIAFYKFKDGTECKRDQDILENSQETDMHMQDMTKWQLVDKVGNVFNRLILFNSTRFHMSLDHFGDSKENGRLFQVFFFSTEK